MDAQRYSDYLNLLGLPGGASAEQIRTALDSAIRKWSRRTSAPALEARQRAERMMQMLAEAETFLSNKGVEFAQGDVAGGDAAPSAPVTADAISTAIQTVTQTLGTRSREKRGKARIVRNSVFLEGVDFIVEDSTSRGSGAMESSRRCAAVRQGSILFEWLQTPLSSLVQGRETARVPGAWIDVLLSTAKELESSGE